eukprot:544532-Pelagomonas_calceolata.AAC.1
MEVDRPEDPPTCRLIARTSSPKPRPPSFWHLVLYAGRTWSCRMHPQEEKSSRKQDTTKSTWNNPQPGSLTDQEDQAQPKPNTHSKILFGTYPYSTPLTTHHTKH